MEKLQFRRDEISDVLKEKIGSAKWNENLTGCTSSRVFRLSYDWGNNYLKVTPSIYKNEILCEKDVLQWLKGRLPVPEVLFYEEMNDKAYLLISEIKGKDASNADLYKNKYRLIELFAEGLRMVHSIDIGGCRLRQDLDFKLERAMENINMGLIDMEDFKEGNPGKTPMDIYEQLVIERPESEDLVFTHGDYCVPNIIIDDNKISGFIDLGRAGIADRYQDIALAVRTIRYNFKDEKFVNLFFKEYGLKNIDFRKIEYYILLDELF